MDPLLNFGIFIENNNIWKNWLGGLLKKNLDPPLDKFLSALTENVHFVFNYITKVLRFVSYQISGVFSRKNINQAGHFSF